MPRESEKQRAVRRLDELIERRYHDAKMRVFFDDPDPFEDDLDEMYRAKLENVKSNRYYCREENYRKREDRWRELLHNKTTLNDTEFLAHFRVTRPMFWKLHALIKNDAIYQTEPHRTFRGCADLHLLVLLKFLGTSGNGNTAPKMAEFFGLGSGSVYNYLRRAVKAVLKLYDTTVTWPDADERRTISRRIQEKYDFVNCVGLIDGTLLPMESKPEANGEDYFTRRGFYAVHALITCDDVARIRDLDVGWSGSVHDNRVWSNGRLCCRPEEFFSGNEYLLGDSAFQASPIMVPAFKKPPKAELNNQKTHFNTKLAKIRIRSEHCIGLVKTRFQYFKAIRADLKNAADLKKIIEYFMCACILHNLLIGEPVPTEWEIEVHDNGLSEEDELNQPAPRNVKGDERRAQLLAYLLELRG